MAGGELRFLTVSTYMTCIIGQVFNACKVNIAYDDILTWAGQDTKKLIKSCLKSTVNMPFQAEIGWNLGLELGN